MPVSSVQLGGPIQISLRGLISASMCDTAQARLSISRVRSSLEPSTTIIAPPIKSRLGWDDTAPHVCGKPTVPVAPAEAKSDAGLAPTVSNASVVVASWRKDFRACYLTERATRPEAAGTVHLTVRVACDGAVLSLQADATGITEPMLGCMFERARASKFEPPEGGSAVIKVPVTFVRQ
jgi:hypothetical protein